MSAARASHGDHAVGHSRTKEAARQALDGGRPRPFAHADQHAAVADHEDVAALDLGRAAEGVAPTT